MTSLKTMTLSMESLNKLYFQFFQRTVLPNLAKQVNEITQLLKQKTAYQVHRYLEDFLATPADNFSTYTNTSVNSNNGSHSSLNTIPSNNYSYQYAIPSQVDHSKNLYTDNTHAFDKSSDKQIQEAVSFKSKLGIRRVQTGLGYQQQHRPYDPFEYKHIIDDNLMSIPTLSSTSSTNEGLLSIPTLTTGIGSDFKLDFVSNKEQGDNKKSKIMREQVRKISKIFNEGHSKIQKYTKNGNETQNKLFNLNISTKLEKRQQSTWIKDYPVYQQRQEIQSWKI